jgi:hypothetical protein
MKKLILFLLLCVSINAQTVLSIGDIAIVRENEDNAAEGFSFVTLVPIAASTVIYFTDEGWAGTAWYGNSEGHFKYTAPAGGLTAGSVIHIGDNGTNPPITLGAGGATEFAWSTTSFNFSGGESIIAYQTSASSKPTAAQLTFIAGIMLNDGASTSEAYDPTTFWTSSSITVSTSNTCQIPTGLTNGVNCFSMFAGGSEPTSTFNVRYNCTLTSGTKSQLLAAINNKGNWIYCEIPSNYATSTVCAFTVNSATITFTNGSGFTQSITPGSSNQVIGRFQLTGNISGSYLTGATIKLNGTRSGLSNFKLWSSTDASFGGDSQVGTTVAADPGDGSSVSFSGFSNSISTSGIYFFLTADVAAGAMGTVQGVLVQNSSLTISEGDGVISGTITNAVLSTNTAPLPVELTSFTASSTNNKVNLNWQTATEVNNYGFEIERIAVSDKLLANNQQLNTNSWVKIGFVKGSGNSNSPKNYSFTDTPTGGMEFKYRLKQIDLNGQYEYSDVVKVTLAAPTNFAVGQNFPNPFNPTTSIQYQVSGTSNVTLKVYDVLGKEVTTLVNENKTPGKYEIKFDGSNLSSGIYFYTLHAAEIKNKL